MGRPPPTIPFGDMHGTPLALAVTGLLTVKFGHHSFQIPALGNQVSVAPVSAGDIIGGFERATDPGGNRLFSDVKVHESG